ncbi:MAG TPA: type II toxin-antitoxin system death-on-curing family toxin [Pararhizobium sp.]|nr:type II toxin-antitoxin system death-on-curing family toxin [Pararhizobium sp.]
MTAFLTLDDILGIHSEQIRQFGGASGIRDPGLLESAVYRPLQKANYGVEDIMELAAALLLGIAKNHPFIDGNKRTAFTAADVFLFLNGYSIEAEQEEIIAFVVAVAAGEIDEEGAVMFFRDFAVVI